MHIIHNLTFIGPCIVIYSHNESQQNVLFLNFILVQNSTCFGHAYCLSSGVLIYSQQLVSVILKFKKWVKLLVFVYICTNTSCCEYSIKTPDDGQ